MGRRTGQGRDGRPTAAQAGPGCPILAPAQGLGPTGGFWSHGDLLTHPEPCPWPSASAARQWEPPPPHLLLPSWGHRCHQSLVGTAELGASHRGCSGGEEQPPEMPAVGPDRCGHHATTQGAAAMVGPTGWWPRWLVLERASERRGHPGAPQLLPALQELLRGTPRPGLCSPGALAHPTAGCQPRLSLPARGARAVASAAEVLAVATAIATVVLQRATRAGRGC